MAKILFTLFLSFCLLTAVLSIEVVTKGLGDDSLPSSMPTEHRAYVDQQYEQFMNERRKKKEEEKKKNQPKKPKPGKSPRALGLSRPATSTVDVNQQMSIAGGLFWFGSQLDIDGKVYPSKRPDGAEPRLKAKVGDFSLDVDCVTNAQFDDFVKNTKYVTEAELYGWSFVLDSQASEEVIEIVDGEQGFGRVKDAKYWMAVGGADWRHPFGPDSSAAALLDHPVVHVSFKDAEEYCAWAGDRRLPSEVEWEYAARGGKVNLTYPWGATFKMNKMNIWDGKFPTENTVMDGCHGTCPVKSYRPNAYGLYDMLGNVWEWVLGGTEEQRVLRGGSFVDSVDGSFNHLVSVSTRQINAGDSGASNIGFRCASGENKEVVERPKQKPRPSPKTAGSKEKTGKADKKGSKAEKPKKDAKNSKKNDAQNSKQNKPKTEKKSSKRDENRESVNIEL